MGGTIRWPCAAKRLANALFYRGTDADIAEAEALSRETCDGYVRRYGLDYPEALFAIAERGDMLAVRGKLEEARAVLAPLPDAYTRTLGPDHFFQYEILESYGCVLEALGDLDGAEAQYRLALAILSKGRAGKSNRVAEDSERLCLARVELSRGRDAAAVTWLLPILRAYAGPDARPIPSPSGPKPLSVPADRLSGALADALADRGEPMTAIEILRVVSRTRVGGPPGFDWLKPHLRSLIGGYELRRGRKDEAAGLLRTAVEAMEKSQLKPPAPVLAAARARLARLDAPGDAKGQAPPSGR